MFNQHLIMSDVIFRSASAAFKTTHKKIYIIIVVKKTMDNVEAFYDEWCQRIDDAKTAEEFIAHFR
ncbi:MAG: hypothetical protein KAR23_02475, partial [Candidatus Aenigmarchaeota archaeon]|nr:hypothetical protein [Candidatus Aenigmarchaeota archaeon]